MLTLNSYPKVYALGHKAIQGIFDDEVLIQEKIDGSQFSFGVYDNEILCRSKNVAMDYLAPAGMFAEAVRTVVDLVDILTPNVTYRGEYLQKPKHNTLAYDRVPAGHIILFDIMEGLEDYWDWQQVQEEAQRLGLESVPVLGYGEVNNVEDIRDMLDEVSILGGQKVEGIVVKNYNKFGRDGKPMFGKYVSESFKEVHGGEWRKNNPPPKDILDKLIDTYRTPARWQKAVQHMADDGILEGEPRDIGTLIKMVPQDIYEEDAEEIKEILFNYFWPKIRKGVTAGLPEWYKNKLLEQAFEE
jgi:hypothetical protein